MMALDTPFLLFTNNPGVKRVKGGLVTSYETLMQYYEQMFKMVSACSRTGLERWRNRRKNGDDIQN